MKNIDKLEKAAAELASQQPADDMPRTWAEFIQGDWPNLNIYVDDDGNVKVVNSEELTSD